MARQPDNKPAAKSKNDAGKSRSDDGTLIRELAFLLAETDLSEIEIERAGLRVRVARNVSIAASVPATIVPTAPAAAETSTVSPGLHRVRVTMSSACVAPTVVMICSGEALMPCSTSRLARARRSRCSPAGSPYCSALRPSCALTLRMALASSGWSSHSAGSVPRPGMGCAPGGWNMPRISVVALIGTGERRAGAPRPGSGTDSASGPRT